jgi:hypothetical protein
MSTADFRFNVGSLWAVFLFLSWGELNPLGARMENLFCKGG